MSLIGIWHPNFIWVCWKVSKTPISRILVILSRFWRVIGHPCCELLIWGLWCNWRYMIGVLYNDIDDMIVMTADVEKVVETPMSWSLVIYLVFEGSKDIHVVNSWFGALDVTEGSWLGFYTMILILPWSLVFDTPMIYTLAWYGI